MASKTIDQHGYEKAGARLQRGAVRWLMRALLEAGITDVQGEGLAGQDAGLGVGGRLVQLRGNFREEQRGLL